MTEKVFVPPLKIQGIKTKLIPEIRKHIQIDSNTMWIEPFMGSGVVGFNVAPFKAIFSDINPHIINFYNGIKSGKITSYETRAFLENKGAKLSMYDADYYLEVRKRFNENNDPLDFLFLNRCCFNGMMRFNKDNKFNVPYGHKRNRFSKAYITKIINQITFTEQRIKQNDWLFVCKPFNEVISYADEYAFIYCDPPYIGRHVDYYDSWNEKSEMELCQSLKNSKAKFMLSTWDHNIYRKNQYVDSLWSFCHNITKEHFYFIGAKEANRNHITESLLMNYELNEKTEKNFEQNIQLTLL